VIGAGHAGCEASLAPARMGLDVLTMTVNLDHVAFMPCNPSIGGPGKGHIVREIDALGGEMARNMDETMLQIRMLNTTKGPAVHGLRGQADKKKYHLRMKQILEDQILSTGGRNYLKMSHLRVSTMESIYKRQLDTAKRLLARIERELDSLDS